MDSTWPPPIVAVGSPSVDVLHFRDRTIQIAGGSGLYTSLAARRAGAKVIMVAPKPDPLPPELKGVAEGIDWRGPQTPPPGVPYFEIEYRPDGETIYHSAVRNAEADVQFSDLPPLVAGSIGYVAPLLDTARQLDFARHLRAAGVRTGCATYHVAIEENPDGVRAVAEVSDFFFCNEREARLLFGSLDHLRVPAGRIIFVTRGARGASVFIGRDRVDVPATSVSELDPTGAGDTFCGTVLARLLLGDHPIAAARLGNWRAAQTVTEPGPTALLSREARLPPPDQRVLVHPDNIRNVGRHFRDLDEVQPFDFTGASFPAVADPSVLDFFFVGCVLQFGFWVSDRRGYTMPMMANLGGRPYKGSDYIWHALKRWTTEIPDALSPQRMAGIEEAEFDRRMRDDAGRNPLPHPEVYALQAIVSARDLLGLGLTPASLVEEANRSARPIAHLLDGLGHVSGYKEDPWRKKASLLALILSQRPERFLRPSEEDVPPIVDYHVMRSCLRMGIVEATDPDLVARLRDRVFVEDDEEEAVRAACYSAVVELQKAGGLPMAALDRFLFTNRTRCPEMETPDCPSCPADPVCAHLEEMFQPVFRTAAY